jgi:hypothetical protein
MPDRVLQNRYCVAALQRRWSYNDVMNLAANQPSNEPAALTSSTFGRRRASARICRTGIVIGTLITTGVLAAACGGGSPSATNPPPAVGRSTNSMENSLLAYTDCMRTHGEPNMAEPTFSDGGVHVSATVGSGFEPNSPQFATANNACKHLLPKKGGFPRTDALTPAEQADYLRAAVCMRSHGILNFPDPTFQNDSVQFNSTTPIDTTSAQYTSALATCQKLIPAGLPYSSSSSGS